MENITDKQTLLNQIRLSEGSTFECDEETILKEYAHREENKSSIAIKTLSIFGGLLATLSGLGFLSFAGLFDYEIATLIIGAGFMIFAIWLDKTYNKLVYDTFSVALFLSGFALLTYWLFQMHLDYDTVMVIVSIIATSSLFFTQNFIHSFFLVLAISGSYLYIIYESHIYELFHVHVAASTFLAAYFFLNEASIITKSNKLSRLYNPIKIGLIFSLLAGLITLSIFTNSTSFYSLFWISSAAIILVILYVIHIIIKVNQIESANSKLFLFGLSSLLLLAVIFSPPISGSILIILLSFLVNYKTGFAIGVISILFFISKYYYDLSFTLLTKSIILFSTGILFLSLYLLITKMLSNHEKL